MTPMITEGSSHLFCFSAILSAWQKVEHLVLFVLHRVAPSFDLAVQTLPRQRAVLWAPIWSLSSPTPINLQYICDVSPWYPLRMKDISQILGVLREPSVVSPFPRFTRLKKTEVMPSFQGNGNPINAGVYSLGTALKGQPSTRVPWDGWRPSLGLHWSSTFSTHTILLSFLPW